MPEISIDECLLAHILNDAFLTGSFELQGNQFSRTIGYLNQYIQQVGIELPPDVDRMRKACSQLVEYENNEEAPRVLAAKISAEIRQLKVLDYLLMPGGWRTRGLVGHAMIYQFKKNAKEDLLFCIYNSGDGLEYHIKYSNTDKERYNPVFTYRIPKAQIDNPYLETFIDLLIQLTRPDVVMSAPKNAEYLYQHIFPLLVFLEGVESTEDAVTTSYLHIAGQMSGTCAQRSLHQILKASFASLDDYRRFIVGFKIHALDDYFRTLDPDKKAKPQFQSQIKKAIHHALRLLNLKVQQSPEQDLFVLEYKQHATQKLTGYLQTFRQLSQMQQNPPPQQSEPHRALELIVPAFINTNFETILIESSMVEMGKVADQLTFLEKVKWLESISTILHYCTNAVHAMKLLQELEHFFVHLPLPAHYNDKLLPYYEEIAIDSHLLIHSITRLHALQKIYLDCFNKLVSKALLPRKLLMQMSLTSVLHHLSYHHQGGHYFPPHNSKICQSAKTRLGMMNPEMDKRFLQIRSLDTEWKDKRPPETKIKCYQLLLEKFADKELIYDMQKEFERCGRDDWRFGMGNYFRRDLTSGFLEGLFEFYDYRALYYLKLRMIDMGEHSTEQRYAQLLEKMRFQVAIEQSEKREQSEKSIWDLNSWDQFELVSSRSWFKSLELEAKFGSFKGPEENEEKKEEVAKNKYSFDQYLKEDLKITDTKEADNEIQSARPNRFESFSRERFYLLRVQADQIPFILDYFNRHLDKLSDPHYQVYFEANIFYPGLLMDQLEASRAKRFWKQFDTLIQNGIVYNHQEGELTQTSLFFVRMAYQVSLYAAKLNEQFIPQLESFHLWIIGLLESNQDKAIRASLLPYCYLTIASGLFSLHAEVEVTNEWLYQAFSAYVKCQLQANQNEKLDQDTLFHRECAEYQLKLVLSAYRDKLIPLIARVLDDVGIISVELPTLKYPLCYVKTQRGEQFTVDIERGLIFNQEKMALIKTPLFMFDHPVFKEIGLVVPYCCFTSMKEDIYQFEYKGDIFRLVQSDAHLEPVVAYEPEEGICYQYRRSQRFYVQRTWLGYGERSYYQWAGLSQAQTKELSVVITMILKESALTMEERLLIPKTEPTDEQVREFFEICGEEESHTQMSSIFPESVNEIQQFLIPNTLKEIDTLAWVRQDGQEILLSSSLKKPTHRASFLQNSHEWVFETVDGKRRLSMNHPEILNQLAAVESTQFIAVFVEKNSGQYTIELARYGVTLTATTLIGPIQLCREGKQYQLDNCQSPFGSNVAHLMFKNNIETLCFMPKQRFISSQERAHDNEYYHFTHDIHGSIMHGSRGKLGSVDNCPQPPTWRGLSAPSMDPADKPRDVGSRMNCQQTLWKYTNTEEYFIFKLKKGVPVPETAVQALYLCYIYLGTHQVENAWKMLDSCHQHLGGLTGSFEELRYLQWIVHQLPYDGGEQATISTPNVVACQLKALSLLTAYFLLQDKSIDFPQPKHSSYTCNLRYEQTCIQKIKDFYDGLNKDIYTLYTRLQAMRRDSSAHFQLSEESSLSLLQFYHQNLPGSCGGYRIRTKLFPNSTTNVTELKEIWILKRWTYRSGRFGWQYHIGYCDQFGLYSEKLIENTGRATISPENYDDGDENLGRRRQLNNLLLSIGARVHKSRAIGALGYEWMQLHFSILKKEWAGLEAREVLTTYEQTRKKDLDGFIRDHQGIAKIESKLEYVAIDLTLPTHVSIEESSSIPAPRPTPDLSDEELFKYSGYYLWLANNKQPKEEFEALKLFCQRSLTALRHTRQGKERQRFDLCNVVYHVCCSYFKNSDIGTKRVDEWIKRLRAATPILIAQHVNVTRSLMLKAQDLWDEMPEPQPIIKPNANCSGLSSPPTFRGFSARSSDMAISLDSADKPREVGGGRAVTPNVHLMHLPSFQQELPEKFQSILNVWMGISSIGQDQYASLMKRKDLARVLNAEDNLVALKEWTRISIIQLNASQTTLQEDILVLANRELQNTLASRIDIETQKQLTLNMTSLLTLYFHDDVNRYQKMTHLPTEQIHDLHRQLACFIAGGLKLQHYQRVSDRTMALGSALQDSAHEQACFHLAQTLFAVNPIDVIEDPALSLFQYYGNLLIRPQQVEAILRLLNATGSQTDYSEIIEKIIMGGGKSKVLLPTLAQKKATGSNLIVIEVPRALLHTNFIDLRSTSSMFFNQTAYLFEFNRDNDCSSWRLEDIYDNLTRVMVNRDYLVTTGDALQSLELKYLELLSMKEKSTEDWVKQVYWAGKLVSLFREKADLIIDEVHQGLWIKNKLNYTLGESESVSPEILCNCLELYRFFKYVPLVIGDKNYTLEDVLKHNNLLITAEEFKNACEILADTLVDNQYSPLNSWIKATLIHNPKIKQELRDYLKGRGRIIPLSVQGATLDIQNQMALYKEQIGRLLPYNLKRNYREHYGPSQLTNLSSDARAVAIPYITNNVPNERSRFGNYLEAVNYTIQSQLISGVSKDLIRHYFETLKIQARKERLIKRLNSVNETDMAKTFEHLTAGLNLKLGNLNIDDEDTLNRLYQHCSHDERIVHQLLETMILKHIRIDPKILHSNAINHVDLVHSCQGMSGTPWNHSTYHHRLLFNDNASKGTDEYTLAGIKAKNPSIHVLDFSDLAKYLDTLLSSNMVKANFRALIDISATFKGIDNFAVVREIARLLRQDPQRFSQPEPIQYILFFNAANILCAWSVLGEQDQAPIELGSSDPIDIKNCLNCLPTACFTFYDQAHTIGADILQADQAQALVMIDHETPLQSFLQGSMRMRGLIEGGQRVDLIVPTALKDKPLEILVEFMLANEQYQLQQDNYEAAILRMIGLVRSDLMQRLLKSSADGVAELFQTYSGYFIEQKDNNIFAQYGGLSREYSTKEILERRCNYLLKDWQRLVKPMPAEAERMTEEMLKICNAASQDHVCSATQMGEDDVLNTQVEVQKEIQQEIQQEIQKEIRNQVWNAPMGPILSYQPWAMTTQFIPGNYKALEFKSLTEICETSRARYCPKFSDVIKASKNFYKTHWLQSDYVNDNLKPVHALLFQSYPTLTCTILSQQELEEIRDTIGEHAWISTTQHTVLVGEPPVDIEQDKSYQLIIEQIRYFNGETSLLLEDFEHLTWLKEDAEKKMHFLNFYLSKGHEVNQGDVNRLCELLIVDLKAIEVEEGVDFFHAKLKKLRAQCEHYMTYALTKIDPNFDPTQSFPPKLNTNTEDKKRDLLAKKYNSVHELYALTEPTIDPVTSFRAFRVKLRSFEALLEPHRDPFFTRLLAALWGIIMIIPRAMFYTAPTGTFNHPFFWRSKGSECCENLKSEIKPCKV